MRGILAVVLVAALLAPSMAWAADYPRRVTVDNYEDCIEEKASSGRIVTTCLVDGRWRVMTPEPKAATVESAVAHPQGETPRTLQLSPDLARLELRPYQGGRVAPRYISFEAADAMADASLKYAWAGAFKWAAISTALFAVLYLPLGSGDAGDRAAVSGISLGLGALVGLWPALALDASARDDVMRASGVTERERDAIVAARERAREEAEAREEAREAEAERTRPARHMSDRPYRR